MWNALSNAAYNAGSYVGSYVVGEGGTANLPSAYPFQAPATPEERIKLAHEVHYKEFVRLVDASDWTLLPIADPDAKDGGDMKLWTRPQEVTHHFIKATFLIRDKKPSDVYAFVASDTLAERQRFGPNLEAHEFFEECDANTRVLYTKFWAPPPVAARDFCFLQGMKHHDDGSIEVWGCSVQHEKYPENGYVRGASMWGWRLSPILDHVQCTYFNVSDPRGWAPSFIFSYLKTQVQSDLLAIRAILHGKDVKVHRITVEECGVSAEEVQQEEEKLKAAVEAAEKKE